MSRVSLTQQQPNNSTLRIGHMIFVTVSEKIKHVNYAVTQLTYSTLCRKYEQYLFHEEHSSSSTKLLIVANIP